MSRHLQTPSAVPQGCSFLYPLERLHVGCAVGDDDDEDIYLDLYRNGKETVEKEKQYKNTEYTK